MGKKPEITAVKYKKAPDQKMARQMLREIAKRPISPMPRKVDKPLIIYGAGNLGKMAREYFEMLGIPFLFVVDADPTRYREDIFWSGVNILGIHDVPIQQKESSLLAICVATAPFLQVTTPLIEQGWRDVVPFYDIAEAYRSRHPLSNGWYSGTLDEQDTSHIESVLSCWEDDISRAHHLQFVAWHTLREEWTFDNAPVTIHDRYFISNVISILHDHEVFVDIGAHHGEVSLRFLEAVKNQYKGIYAAEPDIENFRQLRSNLSEKSPAKNRKVHLLKCAMSTMTGEKPFYQGLGYASQLSELGQSNTEVNRLDDFAIPATLIKIHIEGWERDAIAGGLETIKANRPILAVTSYHNRDGLWILPDQLMECLDDYLYYFRLHSWHGTGSVIYAIPRERLNRKVRQHE